MLPVDRDRSVRLESRDGTVNVSQCGVPTFRAVSLSLVFRGVRCLLSSIHAHQIDRCVPWFALLQLDEVASRESEGSLGLVRR